MIEVIDNTLSEYSRSDNKLHKNLKKEDKFSLYCAYVFCMVSL